MLNNFIYAQSKAMFEERLHEVPNDAIVFIEDTKEIWTHGTYFDCSTLDPSMISNIQTEITNLKSKLEQIGGAQNLWVVDSGNVYLPSGNIGVGYDAEDALTCELSVNGSIAARNTAYFSASSASTNNVIKCTDHNSKNLLVVHNTNGLTLFNTEGTGKAAISRNGKGTFNGGLSVQGSSTFSDDISLTTTSSSERKVGIKNDYGEIWLDISTFRGLWDNTKSKWMIAAGPSGGTIGGTDSGNIWINAGGTSGNTGIGFDRGNALSYKLHVNGSVGATAFYETSDARLKDFHEEIEIDFDKLKNIPKTYFTWKEGEDKNMQLGTSAQKVQELYPELVHTAEDGTLSVDYAKLSIVALAASDKLYEENQRLKKQMSDFEERLNKLENGNRN